MHWSTVEVHWRIVEVRTLEYRRGTYTGVQWRYVHWSTVEVQYIKVETSLYFEIHKVPTNLYKL